ncbi:23S rRNA (uracil(1939)-C(5))-methyltransferase RlmD [Vibrio mimicus]|uniref:23S rRNA (uracil(1939)-C(5))-methyltransferase RlmD n=1 Tax=Vibrio mimicus TaxID=674 RepID=A0A2J9UYK7_VIBMI|nr:23S rRNA (uracil(1939)-C(5))-methyltransferase RlmD [Vibrio mimicus]EEW10076.1 23S rRNA (uracil-5-)-methyltransferase RumA [Vibrio mimicus VM573]EGU21378.1 23S rRNA (uracil-5-)-methyltransferase RumA [Vibrio mimicus SX-4]KFE31752.1 23S rRNA (uracil-5-)-methyltransferase RumA [Vibrio mimicus]PNM56623.1 23S rRNA (uracil(1939)-C(5))-methyltransferase RlmD [Vibrio mimicus]
MARFFQPKKQSTIDKKHQPVTIERLDHQGSGLAFLQKKPLFVDSALPGEEVLIQLTESKSKYARGQLIKVLKPSTERVEPFCAHYAQCGGCDLQHLDRTGQINHKQQALSQLMVKFAGQSLALSVPVCSDDQGYRRRARLSLMWDKKTQQLQFGFRRKQSKAIVSVTHCPVLEPSLNALLPELNALLSQWSQPELLGHVELVKGDNTQVLVLRHLGVLAEQDQQSLSDFATQKGLTLYLTLEAGELQHVQGEAPYCEETGSRLSFLPNHFIQVNRAVNQQMVEQALNWLEVNKQDRVLDLFCGLGNFTLPLAKQAQDVVGVEGVEEMVQHATHNAKLNQINNVAFYQANLEQDMTNASWAQQKFAKVLLDPARAGAEGIVDQLAALGAERVVYVSCNPATLARDSQSLLSQGFRLEKLGMLDMFPHTSHLESMALFVKKR